MSYQDTHWGVTPLQRLGWCILQPQPTGQNIRYEFASLICVFLPLIVWPIKPRTRKSVCRYIHDTFNKFPDFFVQAFKIVIDSWKFTMLLQNILWDAWPIFRISGSKEQLQQQLEYTLLKTDCHCWWISKMQSGREDTLEERYAIKFCFKLGKNAIETYGMLQTAWTEHQFLSCIRDSRKARSLWGMMRGVGGVRKSVHQSWLAKGLGLGLLCWSFKGVQEEIPWKEASTLQIGSVAFPAGQCTSPQLYPCHRLFDQDGHQHSSSASL